MVSFLNVYHKSSSIRLSILLGSHPDLQMQFHGSRRRTISIERNGQVLYHGTPKECIAWLLGYRAALIDSAIIPTGE